MRKCAASSGSKRTATSHSHAAARRARRRPPEWMRGETGQDRSASPADAADSSLRLEARPRAGAKSCAAGGTSCE